jgi:hypothetical protein
MKYYYDCVLKALYMHKEFAINVFLQFEIIAKANLTTREFQNPSNEYEYEPLLDFINDESSFEQVSEYVNNCNIKIIVSKKDNHIFEPRDWDLKNDETNEIIMRGGKHFFMPKLLNN